MKIDLQIENLEQNDLYLLCSDGLHNALSGELIERILSANHKSLQKMIDKLVLSAKQMNGSDNITGGVLCVNHALNGATSPTCYQKTIMDEPDKVSAHLDKTLKTLYPQPKAKFEYSTRWMAISGAAIILIIVFIFFFYRSGNSEKNSPQTMASALLTQEISTIGHISQQDALVANVENAGALVLLQINDDKYLKLLRSLYGARVLDYVKRFNQRMPVYTGKFTWAVADSAQKIIYQNNNIRLEGTRNWRNQPEAPPFVETENTMNSNGTQAANASRQNRGVVYLVGSFDNSTYRNSVIFVNNTRLGSLDNYLDSGFALRPGTYSISIRDANGNILKSRTNQAISSGEIVAVEF
ncbi:MAG: PP2C family protein-serine/threonine phosphatase [bacterium]